MANAIVMAPMVPTSLTSDKLNVLLQVECDGTNRPKDPGV